MVISPGVLMGVVNGIKLVRSKKKDKMGSEASNSSVQDDQVTAQKKCSNTIAGSDSRSSQERTTSRNAGVPHRKRQVERRCPDAIGGSNNLSSQDEVERRNAGWVKKDEHGAHVGARKLWGTRKDTTEEVVREQIGDRFEKADSVEVVRVLREDDVRTRWWFWLKGDEDVLAGLDEMVLDQHWKVQKRSPFLGVATVRVLSR